MLGEVRLVTTEEVLTEVLNFYAEGGQSWRAAAASGVRAIMGNPHTEVLPLHTIPFSAASRFTKADSIKVTA